MGTRGFIAIAVDGDVKVMYHNNSSQPDYLGVHVLTELRDWAADLPALHAAAANLTDPTGHPVAVVAREHPALDARVRTHPTASTRTTRPAAAAAAGGGGGDDEEELWHDLLRYESLTDTLQLGLYEPDPHFPVQSGWAEWGYLIDLDPHTRTDHPGAHAGAGDAPVLEVYRGFQTATPARGRWAGRPHRVEADDDYRWHLEDCAARGLAPWLPRVPTHKAVAPVVAWPLTDLPTDTELVDVARTGVQDGTSGGIVWNPHPSRHPSPREKAPSNR